MGSQKMIFAGFADNAKGFRCINPISKKLVIVRDGKFLENTPKLIALVNDDNDIDSVRELITNIDKKPKHGGYQRREFIRSRSVILFSR